MPLKKPAPNKTIYQLKITLKYLRPPIWRRILVESDITLQQLHFIIQATMGWDNCHLHSWTIGGVEYGDTQAESDASIRNEKSIKLDFVLGTREKTKFYYTYDFGDSWKHEILVEKILPFTTERQYPVCVTGKRACPPEDCGGAWGYAELLSILNSPEHPEYSSSMEWVEDGFDPSKFNLKEINSRLRRMH